MELIINHHIYYVRHLQSPDVERVSEWILTDVSKMARHRKFEVKDHGLAELLSEDHLYIQLGLPLYRHQITFSRQISRPENLVPFVNIFLAEGRLLESMPEVERVEVSYSYS